MIFNRLSIFFLVITIFTLCSCTTFVHRFKNPDIGNYKPINEKEVRIVKSLNDIKSFEVIGKVHVHNKCNFWLLPFRPFESSLKHRLKKEAGAMGANVVTDMKITTFGQFEWFEKHLHGTAVRETIEITTDKRN